jgi:hypothetical protein
MSVFGRRVTPEQLAAALLRGLESGEVVFDGEPSAPAADCVTIPRATLDKAVAAATIDEARAILAEAVRTAVRRGEE